MIPPVAMIEKKSPLFKWTPVFLNLDRPPYTTKCLYVLMIGGRVLGIWILGFIHPCIIKNAPKIKHPNNPVILSFFIDNTINLVDRMIKLILSLKRLNHSRQVGTFFNGLTKDANITGKISTVAKNKQQFFMIHNKYRKTTLWYCQAVPLFAKKIFQGAIVWVLCSAAQIWINRRFSLVPA